MQRDNRMPASSYPVVGTIQLESTLPDHGCRLGCDDSSLELLLASLAHQATLSDYRREAKEPYCLLAARRLNWPAASGAEAVVRANLVQLIGDLQAEFDQLSSGCQRC